MQSILESTNIDNAVTYQGSRLLMGKEYRETRTRQLAVPTAPINSSIFQSRYRERRPLAKSISFSASINTLVQRKMSLKELERTS